MSREEPDHHLLGEGLVLTPRFGLERQAERLSYSEIVETPYSGWSGYSWIGTEGTQYEAFKGKVTNNYSDNDCLRIGYYWWERSAYPSGSGSFLSVTGYGDPSNSYLATNPYCVCPAFSF